MSDKHSILLTQLSLNSDKKIKKKEGKRLKHFAKLESFNLCTHPRTLADTEPGHYGDKEAALRAKKKTMSCLILNQYADLFLISSTRGLIV